MRPIMDLKTITTPILLHLLAREMRFPRLFLLRCKLTVARFKRTLDRRFPQELIDLAGLPIWIYINLKRKIGERQALEIMRIAILTAGVAHWNFWFETVDNDRTFSNLCDQELRVNKIGPTKWNTLEVVDRTDRRFEIKITRCLYHELAVWLNVPEITPLVCQIDNAAFNSYLPDRIMFDRGAPGRRIADGASECRFVWELRSETTSPR